MSWTNTFGVLSIARAEGEDERDQRHGKPCDLRLPSVHQDRDDERGSAGDKRLRTVEPLEVGHEIDKSGGQDRRPKQHELHLVEISAVDRGNDSEDERYEGSRERLRWTMLEPESTYRPVALG